MLLLKLIAIGITTGAGLLQIILKPQTPDSRDRTHAWLQRCLVCLMILGAVVATVLIVLDERQSVQREHTEQLLLRGIESIGTIKYSRNREGQVAGVKIELKAHVAAKSNTSDVSIAIDKTK
jgi:hypothetical protein